MFCVVGRCVVVVVVVAVISRDFTCIVGGALGLARFVFFGVGYRVVEKGDSATRLRLPALGVVVAAELRGSVAFSVASD